MLCLLLCILWFRSYEIEARGHADGFGWISSTSEPVEVRPNFFEMWQRAYWIISYDGCIEFASSIAGYAGDDQIPVHLRNARHWDHWRLTSPAWLENFIEIRGYVASDGSARSLVLHYSLLVFLTLLLPFAHVGRSIYRRARRHYLVRRQLCPMCGYDCRATPERCPECGTDFQQSKG
jgi:hypothetical protein